MSSEHHKESFWTKYIFSQDHKVIGIQYGITSLLFLLFGFSLMLVMRWQLAYPDTEIPLIGWMFENRMLSPDMYNSFGAMHGTIMKFLGVVPIVVLLTPTSLYHRILFILLLLYCLKIYLKKE